ncbi:MAG: site-specific DNA-methyltransferase, partial [Gammaproteobacteria bacterium]|nr:site-specific DNA-methyltransferase [Gammaproteobacteria bacterium]
LVLDSFAGSGTTGAVAHKMKRKWIMVELGEHCYTHIVPRMKQVVDGTDDGGISKSVNWKGGGGFRAYELAPSMLKKDKRKQWIINKDVYNPERLAEAMCKHMGFKYAPDSTYYWMQGRAHETAYIYVTTQTMEAEQLHALNAEVGKGRSLLVCCSAFIGADDIYKNLTIKKIPDAVLKNCEWGCDSYSLGIQGLPIAEADLKTDLFNEEEKNNG